MNEIYKLKRRYQREQRELRKQALGIQEDHRDSSMQRIYTEATKTKRAMKVELFGSKSKASGTEGEETSIEGFVRKILEEFEIKFIEQKQIRFINVDFFVPDLKLVIQVHGCYWHACPTCYPNGPKNKTQRKNLEKDKQANEIIVEAKFELMDIWNHEIKNSPEEVKKRIEDVYKNKR